MAPFWSWTARRAGSFPSWRRSSPTAPTAAKSCAGPWPMPPGGSSWSSAPPRPRASRSSPGVGSSSAPSPGSTGAAASPRTTKTSTEPPSPSSASPASGSCSEDSPAIVIPHELSGRTLRFPQTDRRAEPPSLLEVAWGGLAVARVEPSLKYMPDCPAPVQKWRH